jgi:hypothetical protein
MVIKEDVSININFEELDINNNIDIEIHGCESSIYSYININQAIKLIEFLQEQVDKFNYDIRRNNS